MFRRWSRSREQRALFECNLNQTVRVMAITDDKNLEAVGFMTLREVIKNDCIVEVTVDRRIPF